MHTTLGKLVYREILKIEKFIDHQNEMKMIDVLKDSGQFSQNEMSAFLKKLSDRTQDSFLSDITVKYSQGLDFPRYTLSMILPLR
jgi:hypothetical protein